ncbi:MAG: hypothetical protein ACXVCE_06415 [Bacteriovorax sp.]
MFSSQWRSDFKNNYHLLIPILLFLAFCCYCFRFFVDDTYINFIAAKNLVEFCKLSPSLEYPVNPTTANFHMLLSALVYIVTGPDFLEMGMKILGIATGVGILALLNATLRDLKVKQSLRFIALVHLATAFPLVLWTASAMDTVFDAAFIMISCYFLFQESLSKKMQTLFIFSTFLLILARLDFAIITLPLISGMIIWRNASKNIIKYVFIYFICPVILMLLSLKIYYGTIVPTPIQKASLGLGGMVQNFLKFGGLYFLHFCRINLNIISIVSLILVTFSALKNQKFHNLKFPDFQFLSLAAALTAYVCYIMSQGSVHMMFAFRFYTPLLPALALFLGYALHLSIPKLRVLSSTRYAIVATTLIISLNTSTFLYGYYKNLNFSEIPGGDFTGIINNHVNGWIHLHEEMKSAAIYFGSLIPPESKVFLGVAGIIPYFINRPSYDNGLLGAPAVWNFDYVLNSCDSVKPVPAGFVRHEFKPVSPNTLYYPSSSWCLRQLASSNQLRINKAQADDHLSKLPIHEVTGFEGIVDMAGDFEARYFVENKKWDEMVDLLNQLNSLSDTTTGQRELTGYGRYIPEEYKAKLKFTSHSSSDLKN